MEPDKFVVREARDIAFSRLPERIRKQFAFQHFYTERLDGSSGHLSVKYLAMFISYFCSVFKLEGRRRQYAERPSDKSGRDFARAHKKAQIVFQQLSATYSVVITRYSRHHVLEVSAPSRAPSVVGSGAPEQPSPQRRRVTRREPAFRYESDELVFFELLYQITAEVVRMAFDGDATVQELAVDEANRLFRSRSFQFDDQRRSNELALVGRQLDAKAHSVLENTQQLAELLVPRGPKLMIKYANIQRTPFLACQLPGGTSYLKYQRVQRPGVASKPTPAERLYKVEMTTCTFAHEHRALTELNGGAVTPHQDDNLFASSSIGTANHRSTSRLSAKSPTSPPQLNPSDLSAPSPDLEESRAKNLVSALARRHRATRVRPQSPADETGDDDDGEASFHDLERYYARPASAWFDVDIMSELSAIYQALANGVVVTQLTVPLDLKLTYDAGGILMLDSLPDLHHA